MTYLSPEQLRQLDDQLDDNLNQQPLLLMSLDSAVHSLFLYVETLPRHQGKIQNMALFQALKICIYWIYEYCNAPNSQLEIDFDKASQLLKAADNYSLVWDLLSGSFDKASMPRLYQVEDVAGVITFSAIDATRHAKAITENLCHDKYDFDFDDVQGKCNAFIQSRAESLVREANPQKLEDDLFRMREPIDFCRQLSQFLQTTFQHAWCLDPQWDLDGYSVGDFRKTIEALQSQAKARRLIHSWMCAQNPGCTFDRALLPIADRKTIVHNLNLITQIDSAKLEKIVDDLTLRKGHNFKLDDITHMPFFELSNGQLCWSLFFTEYMFPELTLWRVLNVIRKSSIDRHKDAKEAIQTDAIRTSLIQQARFRAEHVKANIRVPKPYDSEIDLLLIDEQDRFALVVQLKWVVPPIAVKNYQTDYSELTKGLEQADKCLRWLQEKPDDVAKQTGLSEPLVRSLEYEAVVVGRNSMGKSRLEYTSHPIINELIFRWYLVEKKVSLRTFWNSVKDNLYFATNYSLQDTREGEFNGIKFIGKDLAVSDYPDYGPDDLRIWNP
jgi:hypothetical protein